MHRYQIRKNLKQVCWQEFHAQFVLHIKCKNSFVRRRKNCKVLVINFIDVWIACVQAYSVIMPGPRLKGNQARNTSSSCKNIFEKQKSSKFDEPTFFWKYCRANLYRRYHRVDQRQSSFSRNPVSELKNICVNCFL